MSFVDSIVINKPDKYQTLIESKVLAKQLELKVKQYNVLQTEYNDLVRKQTIDRKPSTGGNESLKGRLKQLSAAGKDWLWGVNSADAIWTCKKPCDDSKWTRIAGGLTQIEGGDKEVWGVNSTKRIYKMNQDHSNRWKYIPGSLDNISQGGGWVWGVNSSHNVYKCKQPCDGKWILDTVGIKEDTGSIRNKNECGNAAAKIYGNAKVFKARDTQSGDWSWVPPGCTVQSGGDWAPHWNTRSGTCKSSNMYTCVENKAPVNDDWTLVFRQTNNNWKWSRYNGGTRNIVNNNAANYSRMQNLENFRGDDGKLTFLMTYPANKTLTSPQIWKQTTNPYTVRNNRQGQVDGYEAISVPYTGVAWGGLRWNGKYSLMSGSTNGWWWYALGSFKPFGNNLIPGANNTPVNKIELYVKNKKNQGPLMVQLSCSNDYVYSLDTDKRAWRKKIDGSGEWTKFGNPIDSQFRQINASSSDGKVLAIGTDRIIYETDKNGTTPWKRSSSAGGASGITTISGNSQNKDFYFTNTNDQIYRNSPITGGGNWTDINNENYLQGLQPSAPKLSNDNWKYLGQGKNIDECKVKAVQDTETAYSSVVYNDGTGAGANIGWGRTCYGGVKGGKTNPQYQTGIITSLAPNGTSRLGGDEGQKMLNQMKKFQDEIHDLTKKAAQDNIKLERSKSSINSTKMARNKELEKLVGRLQNDRIQINKLLREPDDIALAEDSNFQQESNYYVYFLWILLVIISLFMASHIITTDGAHISTLTYVFVSIWILILFKYYSQVVSSYGVSFWNYISTLLVNPL